MNSSGDPGPRLYRLLLQLYPADFRNEFGDEMVRCFRDARRSVGTGAGGRARFWIAMLGDLLRSAVKENWHSCTRLMNPNPDPNGRRRLFSMAREYPFGTGAILLSLAGVIGLGLRLRHFEFTEAGYIMAVGQVSVLGLIILISGFIVDLQQELLRRGGREIRICTLILIAAGVGLMIVSIYQVQYFEMLVEEMLSLILQILIFATMWFQLVILNDVRLLYREVGQRTAVKSTS